jgi:hypothetical protein
VLQAIGDSNGRLLIQVKVRPPETIHAAISSTPYRTRGAQAMNSEICRAIRKRKLLQFYCEPGDRIVEPYAYGVGPGGRELLRAFQRAGQSHSREEGWKVFHVDELQDILILDDGFEAPRLGYMRNDPAMTKIYAEL